jgi:hypothetical protein
MFEHARFPVNRETLRSFLGPTAKRISSPHKHASSARMGTLTRTAIGITSKTVRNEKQNEKDKESRMKRHMSTKEREKMMSF